ncbi:vanillate O-demethylase monooxygenase subunit [Sphingobium sp. B11D3B]|uniref:aromatic ring-hydroxylating dioxygenase subunit alpha n=1 Tax=Sphingobium sp. B11D3B TaxID=2940575 RepID=UPI002225E69C|nr:aromatic ring-hydroxylating dioxygenase subunit alpha [Sphingobium sp. B11D3B]MCW2388462.1 vanillate O-demethylase monooxygenase subunit [Sphingobium sp. B11D3B]
MAYVRNAWYVAGWSHELEAEKPFAISILGERIVLWRTASGALHALEDRCVHRLAPLSLGRCEGERLRCMYHGLLFDADGQVVEIPGQAQIPPQARVRRYAVVDRHSWLWVWMGDVDAADERLIPPAVGLDHPDYILGQGHLDYAAEARLINDNLLDFSHLTFVHAESFGSGPQFAATPARITPLERGIRYERWTENAIGSASRRSPEPMDSFMSYDFLIPGVLLMTGGVFPLGTAKACDYGQPDLSQAVSGVTFTSQAVTPMRDKSARYFFSWGPHRSHGDEALRDVLMRMADQAFAEDKVMIEAQQHVIDDTEEVQVMPTVHDRGVTLFNRLVEKLARQESGAERAAA